MGVDFYLKRLVLGNERNVNVQVWDVAGSALAGKMTDKVVRPGYTGLFSGSHELTEHSERKQSVSGLDACNY